MGDVKESDRDSKEAGSVEDPSGMRKTGKDEL